MKSDLPVCPICHEGHLEPAVRTRSFRPHGKAVEVELLTNRCNHCGEETTRAAQHAENLKRLAARKSQYGGLLLGEEILALRKRYGLKQQDASKVFGKGKIAFSRYENEASYPDESTTLLLELAIEQPSVLKSLADKAGVEVPLWAERCEDEQRVKVRALSMIFSEALPTERVQDRFILALKSRALRRMGPTTWSTRLVARQSTIAHHEASNDGQLQREAVAS